jgi:hypothetical protein
MHLFTQKILNMDIILECNFMLLIEVFMGKQDVATQYGY